MFNLVMSGLAGVNSFMACRAFSSYSENNDPIAALIFILHASLVAWSLIQAMRFFK